MKRFGGKRFVAFLDILGFRSWVEETGSIEVFRYIRGFLRLLIQASLPESIVKPDMSVELKDSFIKYINFSDSIVFYSVDDSLQSLRDIIFVCNGFMNYVICGPSRSIRGALAYGDFYADPESNAYVGQALIDAYRLEGSQNWLGFAIHESVAKLPIFQTLRESYPGLIVPSLISIRDSDLKPLCLNWANKTYLNRIFDLDRSLRDCHQRGIKSLANSPSEQEKFERKIEATRQFFIHYGQLK